MRALSTRLLIGAPLVGLLCLLLPAPTARAAVPELQVAPLQYKDTLHAGQVKNGFIDVSNPGDSAILLTSSVKGFKQTGTQGDLQFFDDPDLPAAITVDLSSFTLGPREAVRVTFSVDPAKLPAGGVYAAIFFRTTPPDQTSNSSYVAESANVGTLLIFNNGNLTDRHGQISALHLPFWQFGYGLTGSLSYHNTDTTAHPVGFKPELKVRVLPWGKAPMLTTGLVLPGVTRTFPLVRTGSYFGLLPVIITDSTTHHTTITWIFACTGKYGLAALIAVILIILYLLSRLIRRQPLIPKSFKKLFRRRKPVMKRPLDGLSPKR